MPRGRKSANLPSYDPEHYVVHSRGMRTRWHPDILPALLSWLLMMQDRTRQQKAELGSRALNLPSVVLDGAMAALTAQDKALTMLGEAATQGWSRNDWFGAVARAMPGCIPTDEQLGAPPAKTG